MLISIIIPTYNSSKYIVEALNSTLNQGYKDLELIISDDLSQDDTVQLIEEWLGENSGAFVRTEFYPQQKNLGVRDNTNFLIEKASGDYIRLLEGDDILVENSIAKQVEYVEDSKEDVRFLFSDLLIFSDKIENAKQERPTKKEFKDAPASTQYEMLLYGQRANGPSVFFHRQTMLDLGGYIGARNCADWPTIIKLCMNGVRAHHYPEPLLYYRKHEENISSRDKGSWKQISYEMKKIRNEKLLKKELSWKHKLYCYQDLLIAQKGIGNTLNFKEQVACFFARKLYRLIK